MQKWEYMAIKAVTIDGAYSWCFQGITNYYGGTTLDQLKGKPINTMLNMLGDDGWELVAVDEAIYYLKRPKAD